MLNRNFVVPKENVNEVIDVSCKHQQKHDPKKIIDAILMICKPLPLPSAEHAVFSLSSFRRLSEIWERILIAVFRNGTSKDIPTILNPDFRVDPIECFL